MLSIATISIGQAGNYYAHDDYYSREEKGVWQGRLATEKGFSQVIEKKELDAEFGSMNPKRIGVDLTFSAPKSASIAMHLDDKIGGLIREAWSRSVADTLSYVESNYIYYRKKENYIVEPVKTDNMQCAVFNHYVSRAHDPQLHSHCLILNRVRGLDGKPHALSNERIYENKMFLGQYQRNSFAHQLQLRGFELEVTDRNQGFFEIKGISREQIEAFSQRRTEILELLNKWGISGGEIAGKATLLTRKAKEHKDLKILRDSWRESYHELGITPDLIRLQGQARFVSESEKSKILDQVVRELSDQSFAFKKEEFAREAMKASLGMGIVQRDIDRYIDAQLRLRNFVESEIVNNRGFGKIYYATRESLELERMINKRVGDGKGNSTGLSVQKIDQLISKSLTPEQERAVRHICGRPDKYLAVQGYAGTGKTYMLNAARAVWEQAGYSVRGMTFTGKAARELEKGSQIKAKTIHAFLNELEAESGIYTDYDNKQRWYLDRVEKNNREIWVVDEASMISNRLMAELQKGAEIRGAKVVFVGDFRQLGPIGAGNCFSNWIQDRKIEFTELKDIQRQKIDELRAAVIYAARGDIRNSVNRLNDRIVEIKEMNERVQELSKDYASQSADNRMSSIILAGSNADRVSINGLVRRELMDRGEIFPGWDFFIKGQNGKEEKREFSQGDKIVFLKNDKKLGVKNGQTGSIERIDENILIIHSDDREISLDMEKNNHVDHGYCLTAHKSQSTTVDKAFVYINTHQRLNNANSFYVEISRPQYDLQIYTDNRARFLKAVEKQQEKFTLKDFPQYIKLNKQLTPAVKRELEKASRIIGKAGLVQDKIRRLNEKILESQDRVGEWSGIIRNTEKRNLERNNRQLARCNGLLEKMGQKVEKYLARAEAKINISPGPELAGAEPARAGRDPAAPIRLQWKIDDDLKWDKPPEKELEKDREINLSL